MTYDEVKNAPLNVLVGYLVTVGESDCPCMCKWEANKDGLEHENTLRIYADHIRDDCKKDGEYDTCPQRLAYERVMEAVEKQMPLKVTNMYRCPNCGLDPTIDNDYMLNYCPHCGQALDWSIINETLA